MNSKLLDRLLFPSRKSTTSALPSYYSRLPITTSSSVCYTTKPVGLIPTYDIPDNHASFLPAASYGTEGHALSSDGDL